jgi:multicomponent Na+:H+ antiporter subunit A
VTLVLLAHLVVSVLCALTGARLGRRVFWIAALAPAATVAWVLAHAAEVLDGEVIRSSYEWVPALSLRVSFAVDAFAVMMLAIVGGIGVLVMVFSSGYFDDESGLARFSTLLTLFAGAMTGLVAADDLLLIFIFWELTSILSFGLIGFKHTSSSARAAATQALLITGAGGLCLLAGFVLLGVATGARSLTDLAGLEVGGTQASWAAVLILLGCFTKSAQVPFHGWLPAAMAAPTPVSAYLHSATMVKAGIFVVARLSPSLGELAPWRPLTLGVGLATMIWGGYRALRQTDLKLLLAYGTVSQLGMLVAVFGGAESKLWFGGSALLLAHALFKASLFMVVDHSAGTREIDRLSGVGRRLPVVMAVAIVAGASMAGVIGMFGFVAKEAALVGLLQAEFRLAGVVVAGFVMGSCLTAAYTLRFLWGAFSTKTDSDSGDGTPVEHTSVHQPGPLLVAPAAVLVVPTVVLGLATPIGDELVVPAAAAISSAAGKYRLELWPGAGAPLLLSLLALALGGLLFALRRQVAVVQDRLDRPYTAADLFKSGLNATLSGAARVTGVVQSGSLPVYLGIITFFVVCVPAFGLLGDVSVPDSWVWAESAVQLVVVVAAMVATAGVVLTRRRFSAVVSLGVVGFSVASLFVIQGQPDLALTQLLVETVVVVVFVLVLRHLPDRFPRQLQRSDRLVRAALAGAVGVSIFVLALAAMSARVATPIDAELSSRSYSEGDGSNVVNVILVDFRGLDTMGEAVVLMVAALGVVALVTAGRTREKTRGQADG